MSGWVKNILLTAFFLGASQINCDQFCPTFDDSPLYTLTCKNGNSIIPCQNATNNTILTYSCAPYYEPDPGLSPESNMCIDGLWNYYPTCIPVCGQERVSVTLFIVNGQEVARGNYPWVVAIYSSKDSDPLFTNICSGSILTPNIILTAATCVSKQDNGEVYPARYFRVGAGKYYSQYEDPRDHTAQYAEVALIKTHSEYQGIIRRLRNNIAVLQLKTSLTLSETVQPVCYDNFAFIKPNDIGLVTGWGYTTTSGRPSEKLKEIELRYQKNDECLQDINADFGQYLTSDKFCAKPTNGTGPCRGDGGGGLVFKNKEYNNRFFIHGIFSAASSHVENDTIHCRVEGNALFTRVESYIDWIKLSISRLQPLAALKIDISKKCFTPALPTHGKWVYPIDGRKGVAQAEADQSTQIAFSCDQGYKLSNTNEDIFIILCVSTGKWSEEVMPVCLKVCPGLYSNPRITLSCHNAGTNVPCNKATDNTTMTYKCAPFYESLAATPFSINCYDGAWDHIPHCTPVCGEKRQQQQQLIISGQSRRINYPWVVPIYSTKDSEFHLTNICGGSIITPSIVLTAAHCVTKTENGEKYPASYFRVRAGIIYTKYSVIEEDDDYDGDAQYAKVALIATPIEYRGIIQNLRGDIALLKLETSLKLSEFVQPVCYNNILPIMESNDTITRWMFTGTAENVSTFFRELELQFTKPENCLQELDADFQKHFTADKFCMSLETGLRKKCVGPSNGDGGGGLVLSSRKHEDRFFVQGVLSMAPFYDQNESIPCLDKNALFTNVTSYIDWIQHKVQEWEPPNSIYVDPNSTKCKGPNQPDNGKWIYLSDSRQGVADDQIDANTIIAFSCTKGYNLPSTNDDNLTVQCLPSGEWNVTVMPICQKRCPTFSNNAFATLSCKNENGLVIACDRAANSTTLTYECALHYERPPGTPQNSTCYNGSWDYTPNCTPVCGEQRVSATLFVVNGANVERGTYPWVVALYSSRESDPYFTNICGGSLISTQIVVTAAHCVTKKETGQVYPVRYFRVGAGKYYNQYGDPRDNDTAQYLEVEQIETSEEYRGELHYFHGDIALLKLKNSFTLSTVVQPVCYSDLATIQPNTTGLVTGWGYTMSSGNASDTLKELKLPYNEKGKCWKDFDEDFALRYFTIDKFCAGFSNKNASVCKGDSGNGLVFRNPKYKNRYFIYGIVSLGPSFRKNQETHCNIQKNALFTKVETYNGWIQAKVEEWTYNQRN